jgi:hypothetical protein
MLGAGAIQSMIFSGHESFPLRFSWLAKAVRGIENDPDLFSKPDAIVRLGVGKNMVRSMRHWAVRCGVITDDGTKGHYKPTDLGSTVFGTEGVDPYLEDPATVWLIHWQLCSDRDTSPTTWYWVFNELRDSSFSMPEVVTDLLRLVEHSPTKKKPNRSTIERDVACLVRSYVTSEPDRQLSQEESYDSPLTELSLLRRELETHRIILERGSWPTLSPHIFAYTVCQYWERTAPDSETLAFEQVAYQPGSPGQVFKLAENACVELLESLYASTQSRIGFDRTAGIRQIVRHGGTTNAMDMLKEHYAYSVGKENSDAK